MLKHRGNLPARHKRDISREIATKKRKKKYNNKTSSNIKNYYILVTEQWVIEMFCFDFKIDGIGENVTVSTRLKLG